MPYANEVDTTYTLEAFAADCHRALTEDTGTGGREKVRQYTERACADANFVTTHLGSDNTSERKILHEDPDLGFCIIAHVYGGAKASRPHDHGPSWAIYGQAKGVTEMTEWRVLEPSAGGEAGKVEADCTYLMVPGQAKLYEVGQVHSPSREGETRLIRIEGQNMDNVTERGYFDPVD